jgi:DNA-binding response OmpR family regulator
MNAGRILLVADELRASHPWAELLRQRGVETLLASTGVEALGLWEQQSFDMVIVDDYGHLHGLELCRQLRAQAVNPILVLGPSQDEDYCLSAYAAGADECIPKPVSPSTFLAKVSSWLRHRWTVRAEALRVITHGGLRLEPDRRVVVAESGAAIKLTNLEFRLLHLLMSNRGQMLPSDFIVLHVWGPVHGDQSRLVRHMIHHLRRKIEPDPRRPRYIKTVTGKGYVLAAG